MTSSYSSHMCKTLDMSPNLLWRLVGGRGRRQVLGARNCRLIDGKPGVKPGPACGGRHLLPAPWQGPSGQRHLEIVTGRRQMVGWSVGRYSAADTGSTAPSSVPSRCPPAAPPTPAAGDCEPHFPAEIEPCSTPPRLWLQC